MAKDDSYIFTSMASTSASFTDTGGYRYGVSIYNTPKVKRKVRCEYCRTKNKETAASCKACGAPLPD